jgi:MtrB/PioB family decaheme-associated outer membrane protein
MNRKLIAALLANLFVAPAAIAQSDFRLDGFIGLGGLSADVNARDAAKLNEYQDLSNGVSGMFGLTGRSDTYWLNAYGENIVRDDMYVDLRGGRYDMFKYRVYTNWLTHNFGFGDAVQSPYSNPGSVDQRTTFPRFNPYTWTGYDMKYDRRDTGASFEWKTASPWYGRVDFNQVSFDGNKLYAASNGTSPGNGFVDLAGPVDYKTNNLNVEGGYVTRNLQWSVAALWSSFDNSNTQFTWTNPFFANGIDTTTTAPNNDLFKLSGNFVMRNLFWNSQLAARATWSRTESDADLLQQMLNYATPTGTPPSQYAPITANTTQFEGKEQVTTVSLSWTANPWAGLDTKAYYNYFDRDNKSNDVEFNSSALNCTDFSAPSLTKPSVPCHPEKYSYSKNNLGINAYQKLGKLNRIGGGWDYWDIDREGTNYDKTETNTLWVEWATSMIPESNLRLKYAYSWRRSDYKLSDAGIGTNDPYYLERFTTQFDQQDRDQNLLKVTFDTMVAQTFDLGLEFNWQDNNYPGTSLGRTGDKRYGAYGSIAWGDPRSLRLSLFGDIERVKIDAYHRYIGAGSCGGTGTSATGPACFDPGQPPYSAAYNWRNSNTDDSWALGGAVAFPVTDRLKLSASLLYSRNSGEGNIDADSPGNIPQPLDIKNYDTYKQISLNLRADWRITRHWEVSGGYSYQKYDWRDDQYDNAQYIAPPTPLNTSSSYLNGVYTYPNYNANIFWVMGKYYF